MTDSNKQSITEEIDLILPADLTSLSTQNENKYVESKLFKVVKYIVLVGSGGILALGFFFVRPKKAHAVLLPVSAYSTTTSSTATPSTMGRTLSLESSFPPFNPVGISHACNVPLANSNPPYSSALIVARSKQVPTFQNRSLIASQDPFSTRCSAITLRQPRSKVSHGKLTQKKSQPPIFSKSPIFLETDFTFIFFQWKKRRPLVKGRKRRVMIRGLHSKPLQHQGRFSLAKYVNNHRRIPLRTRRMPLQIPLLQRPRKRSVWAFSLNNDEKESKEGFDLGIIIRPYGKMFIVVSSKGFDLINNLFPSLIYLKLFLQKHVVPLIKNGSTIESLLNVAKLLIKARNSLDKSIIIKNKKEMLSILEYNQRQQKVLQDIKDDPSLEDIIREAFIADVKNVEEVARPELATNRTVVRFNVLPKVWDCEETQIMIDAYDRGEPQLLLNTIVATRYLSLWTPEFPIYVSSAWFKQRMLEKAACFTSKINRKLRFTTASEKYSSKPLAREIPYLKLSLFSHALSSLDTEIKKKEEIFPSENYNFWVKHEKELISTSFEDARKRYEQTSGRKVLENDLHQCIKEFLEGDIL